MQKKKIPPKEGQLIPQGINEFHSETTVAIGTQYLTHK